MVKVGQGKESTGTVDEKREREVRASVSDPKLLVSDVDTRFQLISDPDLTDQIISDPNPTFHVISDPTYFSLFLIQFH